MSLSKWCANILFYKNISKFYIFYCFENVCFMQPGIQRSVAWKVYYVGVYFIEILQLFLRKDSNKTCQEIVILLWFYLWYRKEWLILQECNLSHLFRSQLMSKPNNKTKHNRLKVLFQSFQFTQICFLKKLQAFGDKLLILIFWDGTTISLRFKGKQKFGPDFLTWFCLLLYSGLGIFKNIY